MRVRMTTPPRYAPPSLEKRSDLPSWRIQWGVPLGTAWWHPGITTKAVDF